MTCRVIEQNILEQNMVYYSNQRPTRGIIYKQAHSIHKKIGVQSLP
jgi:hypothetical protein